MNVLIIGDEHSHGFGLRAGQLSYVAHLVRQVSRSGQSIQVEVHTPPTALSLLSALDQLPLHKYDLILVHTDRIADELKTPMAWLGPFWPVRIPATLVRLLTRLRPFRHTVVMLTPLPHQQQAIRQRRNWLRILLMREADRQQFSLFDSRELLLPQPEYFLNDNSPMLNAVSHELLGRSLYAFYQSAPTIVTIQPIRRG